MESFSEAKDLRKSIRETSPLFEYWKSEQNEEDEVKRLQMSNNNFPAAGLFTKEPYKWEILYQSIIRELLSGDKDAIKGLRLLIGMLKEEEQENEKEVESKESE